MIYFQEEHTCGWTCPNCGEGIATSYFDPMELDQTVYSIYIEEQNPQAESIKALSKISNTNYLEARQALIDGTMCISGKASTIHKKVQLLKEYNVLFRIEPDYPY